MSPPLIQYVAAYTAGLWVGLVVFVPLGVVLILFAAGGLAAWRGGWGGALFAALVVGILVGVTRAEERARGCARCWGRGDQAAWIRLEDAPDRHGMAWGRVVQSAEGCGGRLRLRFETPDRPPSGVTLIAVGTYLPPYVFRVDRMRVLSRPVPWRYRIRDAVAARARALYGPRAPVVEALVLGRRGDIDPGLRQTFVDAGIAHLLAISGLHVGMLAGWLVLLSSLHAARRTAWGWAAAGIWAYVALLGFPAPATRAAAFISIYAVARVRQRRPPPLAVLAAAVLVVVAVDPAAATAVGAWLSVAAVWGTAEARRLLGREGRPAVLVLLVVSAGAVLATAPITAFAFGSVAPAGLITNLVAIPLASVAVPGVFASFAAGGVLAGGAGLTLAAIERVAELGAALPGGHLTGTPGWRFALPWLLLLAVATYLARARNRSRRRVRRVAWVAALSVWGWVGLGAVAARRGAGLLEIHVLDVGQGDAIAIRTPAGRWMLIDGGPRTPGADAGRRTVVPFLRRRGVRSLELLVVSHGDADHLGGVPAVVRAVPAGVVLEPGQPLGSGLYGEYLGLVAAAGARWVPARAGDTVRVDGVTLAVLHPSPEWAAWELRPNENSVVLHLAYGGFDALFTGDIGWPAESVLAAAVPRAEVLKVGHHGSRTSTRAAWLDAVAPKVGVISVGRRNRYGHPAPEVVERLQARGVTVFRTDRDGTVTIRTDGRYFEVGSSPTTRLITRMRCHVLQWLRSRASSSSRSGCTPRPRESSPTSFTMWP